MAQHYIQTCWAGSEMDCYYFGCQKIDKCEYHKLLKSGLIGLKSTINKKEKTK